MRSARPAAADQRSSGLPEFRGALGGSTRPTFQLLFTAGERLHNLIGIGPRTLMNLDPCSDCSNFLLSIELSKN